MKAIDTNILVRFLVKDDLKQADLVYRLFSKARETGEKLFVPSCVVLELIWVLGSVYKASREKILNALESLLYLPELEFENRAAIQTFVRIAKQKAVDLSDVLIGSVAKEKGCESVITFDKKAAARTEMFELLS